MRPCCDNCKHYDKILLILDEKYCFHPARSLNQSDPFTIRGLATEKDDCCQLYEPKEEEDHEEIRDRESQ